MNVLERLRREWFPEDRARDPDAAARSLWLRERNGGKTLGIDAASAADALDATDASHPSLRSSPSSLQHLCDAIARHPTDVVELGPDVYPRLPTAEARVRLLAACRSSARSRVVLHVPLVDDATHRGRIVFDGPRRLFRALGLPAAEPGDRFATAGYRHHFFDEEPLVSEAARAGLSFLDRSGARCILAPADAVGPDAVEDSTIADDLWVELARVLRVAADVERMRLRDSPDDCVAILRSRGARAKERGRVGRARLRRAIGWVDAGMPGGANCFRRVLIELALDAGSARRTLVFGLDVGKTGHVAFASDEERRFDVAFEVPPRA